MFLKGLSRSWHTQDGSQHAQGAFLLLVYPENPPSSQVISNEVPIRGLVRRVYLRQSGHFMVGTLILNVDSRMYKIPLSGAYGADGLIRDVHPLIYAKGKDLPEELREKWNKGEGWNGAGTEAPAMDEWAKTLVYPASTYGPDKKRR